MQHPTHINDVEERTMEQKVKQQRRASTLHWAIKSVANHGLGDGINGTRIAELPLHLAWHKWTGVSWRHQVVEGGGGVGDIRLFACFSVNAFNPSSCTIECLTWRAISFTSPSTPWSSISSRQSSTAQHN